MKKRRWKKNGMESKYDPVREGPEGSTSLLFAAYYDN